MSVLSTIMCVLHEPPRCRGGQSSESHPLELELLTVVSCCLAVSLHAQREIPSNSLSWEISPQSCGTMMVLRKEKISWDCTTGVKVLASENSLCPLQIINNLLFCSVNFVFPFPPLLWTLDKNGESTTLWHSGVNRNFWRSGEFSYMSTQVCRVNLLCFHPSLYKAAWLVGGRLFSPEFWRIKNNFSTRVTWNVLKSFMVCLTNTLFSSL